jgi:hypothetical protein
MKATAKLFFRKSKTPAQRIKVNGAVSVGAALGGLQILIGDTRASRAEIVITVPRRRSA